MARAKAANESKEVKEKKRTDKAGPVIGYVGPRPKRQAKPAPKVAPKAVSNSVAVLDRAELQEALVVACEFAPKKPDQLILSHVLVEIGKGSCCLAVTDLALRWDMSLKCSTPAEVRRCIPARLLRDEVKALEKSVVEVELKFSADEVSVNGRCVLKTLSPDEFPQWPRLAEPEERYIEDLSRRLGRLLLASGEDDTRYTLNSVCIDLAKGRLVATDGHRLHIESVPEVEGAREALIPRRAAQLASRHKCTNRFRLTKTHAEFLLSVGTMSAILIEGRYPDAAAVIPVEPPVKISFDGKALLKLMDGAAPLARGGALLLTINGRMEIKSVTPGEGEYSWHLDCKTEGKGEEDIRLALNVKYLKDALNAYAPDSGPAVIEYSAPISPLRICGSAIVMPMRV